MMLVLNGLNIINNAWVSSTILFSVQECPNQRVFLMLLNTFFLLQAKMSLLKQGNFCGKPSHFRMIQRTCCGPDLERYPEAYRWKLPNKTSKPLTPTDQNTSRSKRPNPPRNLDPTCKLRCLLPKLSCY